MSRGPGAEAGAVGALGFGELAALHVGDVHDELDVELAEHVLVVGGLDAAHVQVVRHLGPSYIRTYIGTYKQTCAELQTWPHFCGLDTPLPSHPFLLRRWYQSSR